MKLKISFDKKAIGNFFLMHTEKVVFGIFLLAFVSILYGAVMRREKFDKIPSQLAEKCTAAQRSFEGERPSPLTAPDYKTIASKYEKKNGINVEPYKTDVVWDSPVFPVRGKRKNPTLFGVGELRAAAEFGAFQVVEAAGGDAGDRGADARRDPRGGGRATGGAVHGKCWVVLTGLVPFEEQLSAYKDAFRDAMGYDPTRDTPTYASYSVMRAEIKNPADMDKPDWKPDWKPCGSKSTEEALTKDWLPQGDVIDQKYSDPVLTFPLGPLTKRKWGKNVAHEPEISVLSGDAAGGGFIDRRDPRVDTRRGGVDPRGRGPTGREAPVVLEGDQIPKYKLFRFFDFNVDPGKSYIYKVQLSLNNPNYQVPASQLDDALSSQKETIETKDTKSDPAPSSSIVYVPTDTQILVDSVKPKAGIDYTGKVLLLKWMKTTGQEAYKDFRDNNSNLERGQLLNFNNEKLNPVAESSSGTLADQQPMEATNLITDATLLDMAGGKKLKGRDPNLTEPGDMLLMFVRGNSVTLMTRDELGDMAEVKRITSKPEEATRDMGRGPPTDRRGNPLLDQETDPRRDPRADPRRTPPTPPPGRRN